MGKNKVKILIVVVAVVCVGLIIGLGIFAKKKIDSNNSNNPTNNSGNSTSINIEDYKDEIKSIKYKTKNGVVYEDDMIRITTYDPDDEEEKEDEKRDLAFNLNIRNDVINIKRLYVYNKTNKDIKCKAEKIKISNYILDDSSKSYEIESGHNDDIDMFDIYPASYFIQAMGMGALNNIEIDLSISPDANSWNSEDVKKTISVQTDCKTKAKKFDVADKKLYDKNGIRVYWGRKYIDNNEKTAESIKDGYKDTSYFDDKIIQNDPTVWLYVVNENNEEKEITIKVECDNKETEKRYFGSYGNSKIEKITENSISSIMISADFFASSWIEKKYEYNPNNVKYTINIDGKDEAVIDFKDAETK